jgi:GT2 family glycosyltransferase
VIIPVYNKAGLTKRCLQVLVADADVGEIVVVDDGSTDATPQLLASFGRRIRVVTHPRNLGFARSCNDGAAMATGDSLVFLNNDTLPEPGWLGALEEYAAAQPGSAVIGGKLLYPDGTIQHAGVVICQDGYPRHLYSGFPADHPAVSHSRRFQIVTAACMWIRRRVFEELGGFDPGYRNGFEDVDLCLRAGEAGYEVHYCAGCVVHHFESVSPGRFQHDRENVDRYRDRWSSRVEADDLRYYLEDGLLRLNYEGRYPVLMEASPLLAVLDGGFRRMETERQLLARSRQVAELTRENTLLRAELAESNPESPALGYDRLRREICEAVDKDVPCEAIVVVASKGDGGLLEIGERQAWHYPQSPTGAYAGHHPADSAEAITQLEELRAQGGTHFVLPRTAFWWLQHYAEFGRHLETRYPELGSGEVCRIFVLKRPSDRSDASPSRIKRACDEENRPGQPSPAGRLGVTQDGYYSRRRQPVS